MARPVAIFFFDFGADAALASLYCFDRGYDYMEDVVAGHAAIILYGPAPSAIQELQLFSYQHGLIFTLYVALAQGG